MNQKTVSKRGKYYLTDEDQTELNEWLATELIEIVDTEESMKENHKFDREDLKDRKEVLVKTAIALKRGFREDVFECIIEYEGSKGMKHYRDIKSDQIIASEPMTEAETAEYKQGKLDY